jgi:hypothetical protein
MLSPDDGGARVHRDVEGVIGDSFTMPSSGRGGWWTPPMSHTMSSRRLTTTDTSRTRKPRRTHQAKRLHGRRLAWVAIPRARIRRLREIIPPEEDLNQLHIGSR